MVRLIPLVSDLFRKGHQTQIWPMKNKRKSGRGLQRKFSLLIKRDTQEETWPLLPAEAVLSAWKAILHHGIMVNMLRTTEWKDGENLGHQWHRTAAELTKAGHSLL